MTWMKENLRGCSNYQYSLHSHLYRLDESLRVFDDVTESVMSVFNLMILPGVATIDSAGSDLANLICFFCLKWLKKNKQHENK